MKLLVNILKIYLINYDDILFEGWFLLLISVMTETF